MALTLKRDLYVTGRRGAMGSVQAEFELPQHLIAPLSAETALGKARIVVDGSTIAAHDLYAAQEVPRGGVFRRAIDSVKLWFD